MANIPILILVASCITGCISVVDVKKLNSKEPPKGLTYYLPQLFLMLTPSKDGTMKVEPLYLPDPAHRYSVTTYSVLGNYTIDVKRSHEGFLETVSFNSDNTGIAKQLMSSGATFRATELEAGVTDAKAKALEEKGAAEKVAASIAAAEKAKAEAAITVQIAQSKVDYLNSLAGTPAAPGTLRNQIVAAELALREALVKYGAASTVRNEIVDRYKSANAPKDGSLMAPEPVLLKVTMTESNVTLMKAFRQMDRQTWKVPVEKRESAELEILPNAVVMRPAARTGALTETVRSTVPILGYVLRKMTNAMTGTTVSSDKHPITGIQLDKTSVRIDMPKATPDGTYQLEYVFTINKGDEDEDKKSLILVKVER